MEQIVEWVAVDIFRYLINNFDASFVKCETIFTLPFLKENVRQ